eukprot:scaffold236566_cov13-Tisochrysis_lutea.AAC.1
MRRARAGGAGGAPENLRIFETRCGVPTERAGTPQPPPLGAVVESRKGTSTTTTITRNHKTFWIRRSPVTHSL